MITKIETVIICPTEYRVFGTGTPLLVGIALIIIKGNKLFKSKCQKRIREHLMKENDTKTKTEIAYIELHLDQINKTLKDLQTTVDQNRSSRSENWSSPIIARNES